MESEIKIKLEGGVQNFPVQSELVPSKKQPLNQKTEEREKLKNLKTC